MVRCFLHPVFLLLAGIVVVVTARVDPPSNVSMDCKNLHNILKWFYKENTTDLLFRVEIGALLSINTEGFRNVTWVNATAREADLSFLSEPKEQYNISVKAVLGKDESDASPSDGLTFSYYMNAPVDYTCFLDLPSVNVTEQPDNKIQWQFEHPWLLYHHKMGGRKKSKAKTKRMDATQTVLPVFSYEVVLVDKKPHEFNCDKVMCVEDIPVDQGLEKHCIQIEGSLKEMMVKGNGVYCSQALIPPDYTYIYMLVALLVITAVAGVIIMVFYKKTRPSTQTQSPNSMKFSRPLEHRTVEPDNESITFLDHEATSPLPLLTSAEERVVEEHDVVPFDQDDFRIPIRPLPNDPDGAVNIQANHVSVGDYDYRQGSVLEEEGYMARPRVADLSDEEGYRGAEDLEQCSGSDRTS